MGVQSIKQNMGLEKNKMKKIITVMAVTLMMATGCTRKNPNELIIGASPTPHAEILEVVKPLMKDKGYELTIRVFNDYVTPNISLENGDIDANYFQHTPYMEDYNAKNNAHLVGVKKIHFEPMGIYSTRQTELKSGLTIAIPNDTSNGERARELLRVNKITGTIIEMEAQVIPAVLTDVDYACINGNYALSSKVTDKCLVTESTESQIAQTNANIIAVKSGNENEPKVKALVECLTSNTVKEYITKTYGSSVIAMF